MTHLKKSRATSQRIQRAGIANVFSAPNLQTAKLNNLCKNLFLHQVCTELQYLRKDVQAAENCWPVCKEKEVGLNMTNALQKQNKKKGSYLPRSVQPDHPQVDLLGVRKKLSSYKGATPARLRAHEVQQFPGSRCSASWQGWKGWSQGWQKVPSLWSRYVPLRPSCPPERKTLLLAIYLLLSLKQGKLWILPLFQSVT